MHVSPRAQALRREIDTIVFDMDGVLLDVTESIRVVNCRAVPYYLREVLGWQASDQLLTSDDIERMKHAGGFNDDWDLTYALVLFYLVKRRMFPENDADTLSVIGQPLTRFAHKVAERGGGLEAAEEILLEHIPRLERDRFLKDYDKGAIRQIFQELFAGERTERMYGFAPSFYHGKGYVALDKPLIDRARIPKDKKIGILTGRTYEEAIIGREFCQLVETVAEEACVTKADGFDKPNPGGLEILAKRLGTKTGGIYIGDTLDDLRTVEALNKLGSTPPFLAALVLSGPAGKKNESLFRREGADIVAADVNEVLDWINQEK